MQHDDKPAGLGCTEQLGQGSEARWCVVNADTGMTEAKGYAPTAECAAREAAHYAMQYAQDGPVRWWVRQGRKTVLRGSMQRSEPTVRDWVQARLDAIGAPRA